MFVGIIIFEDRWKTSRTFDVSYGAATAELMCLYFS